MTLIEEGELERLRQRQIKEYNPTLKSLSQIQEQIDSIFADPNLDDEGKMKMLNLLQEKFDNLYNKYKNSSAGAKMLAAPIVIPPPANPGRAGQAVDDQAAQGAVGPDGDAVAKEEDDDPFTLLNLPPQYTKKFDLFKKFFTEHPNDLSVNNDNELVVDGRPLANSFAPDLFRSLYLKNKKGNLTGRPNFITKLENLKADPAMFSNKTVLSSLSPKGKRTKPFGQTGKGYPPGKRPRILHVFR